MINSLKKLWFPIFTICMLIGIYFILLMNIKPLSIPKEGDMGFVEANTQKTLNLKINGQFFDIFTAQPNQYFDINKITTEIPSIIEFDGEEWNQYNVFFQDVPVNTKQIEFLVPEISDAYKLVLRLNPKNGMEPVTYYFNTRHSELVQMEIMATNFNQSGFYYFAPINTPNSFAIKMDSLGNIITQIHSTTYICDFKPTKINDKIYYSYLEVYNQDKVGRDGCKAVVMNGNYEIIDLVETTIPIGAKEEAPLDLHDFIIIDDKHYLIGCYYPKIVNNIPAELEHNQFGTEITSSLIQEIKNDELIFQWDSADYPELYAMSVEWNDYYNNRTRWSDYIHWNSFIQDSRDGSLVCSFRNIDAILKIERPSGNIKWVLGGKNDMFGLTAEKKFRRQHFAQIQADGSITLFDNAADMPVSEYLKKKAAGIKMEEPISRIQRFWLNEENFTIVNYEEYRVGKQYSPAMGSAQLLDDSSDRYIIGWGLRDDVFPMFSEVSFSDSVIYFKLFAKKAGIQNYRVYKYSY